VSKKRRSGGHEEEVENGERWLLTYADMITLLLALFIVLFAISTVNQKKFLALALGLKQTFNPTANVLPSNSGLLNNASLTPTAGSQLSKPTPTVPLIQQSAGATTTTVAPASRAVPSTGTAMSPAVHSALVAVENQINRALVARGLEHNVTTSIVTRGLIVQVLADKVFFATGSADLGTVGSEIVDTVAGVIRHDPYNVDVEGYTDNQPLAGGPYGSNTGLSAMRAVNVVERLTTVDGLNPNRLAATGYGETHQAAPNDSPAHMALNRRIDLVILAPQEAQP
jgi:chemotaxis protein MotB